MTRHGLSIRLALCLGALSLALNGCGDSHRTLTVKVWPDWTFVKDAAREFERTHPDVTVRVEGIPDDYFSRLTQTLSSSAAPDITGLQVIPGAYTTAVREHLLADVTDVWQAQNLASVYRASTERRYRAPDDRRYAISTALQWAPVVFYNRKAFAKAGLTPPRDRVASMADWYRMTAALSRAGYVPMATYGISDEYGAAFIFASMVESGCGEKSYNDLVTSWMPGTPLRGRWNAPCVLRALQLLKTWAARGIFGESPATQSSEQGFALFQTERAAMYESGSWSAQQQPGSEFKFPFGWFLLPPAAPNGSPSKLMLLDHDGLGVSSKSADIGLAKEFLSLIASRRFQSTSGYFNTAGVPPRKDVPVPRGVAPVTADQMRAISRTGSATGLTVAVPYQAQIAPLLAVMLAGQRSPASVANRLDELVREARSAK